MCSSIETLNNRAIDGEARTAECSAPRSRDQTVLHKGEDLKFLTKLSAKALSHR